MDIEHEMQRVRSSLEAAEWYRKNGGAAESDDELDDRIANLTVELNAIPLAAHLEPAIRQAVYQAVAAQLQTAMEASAADHIKKIERAYHGSLRQAIDDVLVRVMAVFWLLLGFGVAATLYLTGII